jgi:hypothetical protein
VFSRHFQQYFSYIVADLLLHDSVLYGEHCQYSNSHYQTLFITFEFISSQTVLNSNRSIMSIPDEQTIEDTKRVIKNGSRSKSSTVPQLYPKFDNDCWNIDNVLHIIRCHAAINPPLCS